MSEIVIFILEIYFINNRARSNQDRFQHIINYKHSLLASDIERIPRYINSSKLKIDKEQGFDVKNVKTCGKIFPFREEFQESVSAFNPEKLEKYENMKFYGNSATLDDPILREASDADDESNIFITDKLLAVVMTSVYFSHPWHIKISKVGDKIFFDKMEKSFVDFTSVNESDSNPVNEDDDRDVNNYNNLCIEASFINEYIKEGSNVPRKGHTQKRDVLADPMYNSKVVTKLVNNIMLDGKKGVAQKIVYGAFAKIEERAEAKKAKDFARADAIRDELLAAGVEIKDTREGVTWKRA